jgi:hypothetical protein
MKSKWSEFLSGLNGQFASEPRTPEQIEFNQIFKRELDYIGKNKESLAHERTMDYLESRHRSRIFEVEEHLEYHGLKFGTPEYTAEFKQTWTKFFGDIPGAEGAKSAIEKDQGDFEPEI